METTPLRKRCELSKRVARNHFTVNPFDGITPRYIDYNGVQTRSSSVHSRGTEFTGMYRFAMVNACLQTYWRRIERTLERLQESEE